MQQNRRHEKLSLKQRYLRRSRKKVASLKKAS